MNALKEQIVAARAALDRAKTGRDEHLAWETMFALRRQARAEFALDRGWRSYPRTLDLRQLKAGRWLRVDDVEWHYPELDHADGFVSVDTRRGTPVGLVSHSYAPFEKCSAFAERHGLTAELLSWSWYFPGFTIGVLYTRKAAP